MNMEAQTDRAVELATDAAAEAYSVLDKPFVYDAASWELDCGDMVTGMDNAELRSVIRDGLFWLDSMERRKSNSMTDTLNRTTGLARVQERLFEIIMENVKSGGVTLENIGELK